MDGIRELLITQHGVINRRQALEAGLDPPGLRTLVRRRDLVRLHQGVYLDHTGPPDWLQRAWAAVLAVEPAALWGPSALRAMNGPGLRGHDERGPVHVVVDGARSAAPARVVLHRVDRFGELLTDGAAPARVRPEDAVIDAAASAASDHDAVTMLIRALHARMVTAEGLRAAVLGRSRLPRRRLLREILDDAVTESAAALERAYLRDVEAAHGLPAALRRIVDCARGPQLREIEYAGRLVVELDGGLGRNRCADVLVAADGAGTEEPVVRLGWGQVAGSPCDAAIRIVHLLRALDVPTGATACPACRWRSVWAA